MQLVWPHKPFKFSASEALPVCCSGVVRWWCHLKWLDESLLFLLHLYKSDILLCFFLNMISTNEWWPMVVYCFLFVTVYVWLQMASNPNLIVGESNLPPCWYILFVYNKLRSHLLVHRRRHAIHSSDSTSSSSDDEQFQRRRSKNRSRSVNRWEQQVYKGVVLFFWFFCNVK